MDRQSYPKRGKWNLTAPKAPYCAADQASLGVNGILGGDVEKVGGIPKED